jgi:hypothetical protein
MTQAQKQEKPTNGFALHGIGHSSPSSINLWANAPDVYIANKLMGVNWPGSPTMHRGIQVENAAVNVLTHDWAYELALETAMREFGKQTVMWPDRDKVDKENEAIGGCLEQAIEGLLELGKPHFVEGDQIKIELQCDLGEFELPIIGFLDLFYPDEKLIVDLKTTLRMPSVMSIEHNRQAQIYQAAYPDYKVLFLYVTPKKHAFLEPYDAEKTLADVKTILRRQEKFLAMSDNPQVLADCVPVNPGSFYWSGEAAEAARKELYDL